MTVKVDKEVLAATVVALEDLAEDLPALFSRASALDARVDLAGLNGAEQWARDVSKDLRQRIGVLEHMAQANPTFGGVSMTADQAAAIAGQSMSVEDALIAVHATNTAPNAWNDTDPANLAEWFEQLQAEALEKLAGMTDSEQATALVDAYHDVQNFVVGGGAAVAAAGTLFFQGGPALARWLADRKIIQPGLAALAESDAAWANRLSAALTAADRRGLAGKVPFKYPGSFVPNTVGNYLLKLAPTVEDFDAWVTRMSSATQTYAVNGEMQPTLLAKLLQSEKGVQATTWVSRVLGTTRTGQLATRLATWGNAIVGKPWINPATGVVVARGAGNLLTMANQSGVTTMLRTAGGLRVLGVAGSAFATVDGAVGLYNNFDENNRLWSEGGTKGKAHVIGEYAETAFNASMTAALIAPNPVTLGLVAVTGLVWAGAEVVEHWDDITAAYDTAVDWAGDRAEEAGEWVGDRLDDIKESDLNPMNWF
ncbi:hypothetical protein [Cellulomonas fimi]|uniref:hypothetical protein n=1 Tax=Cellulomonas fimi TaxID=1708 RepID=UPI0023595B8E|nr:hypothetical protein [Cellulomonas fimi]